MLMMRQVRCLFKSGFPLSASNHLSYYKHYPTMVAGVVWLVAPAADAGLKRTTGKWVDLDGDTKIYH